MTEDRLEKALEEMKKENVGPEQLASARTRVWEKLVNPGLAACGEFQPGLRDYLDGKMIGNRRLLMEDHLSRCTRCRMELAGLKGERKVVAMPKRHVLRWPRVAAWAAAAALVFAALYAGRNRIDIWLAPGGPSATVASVNEALYSLPQGVLQSGAAIGEGEVIRTGPATHAVLQLADGSRVELNERTELYLRSAWSGKTIHLQRGDIIIRAAKQSRGKLRVLTRDSVASVKGTVFAVSSGLGGTVVSVVEGSVEVAQPGVEVVLSPGEQSATNPALTSSVQDAVSWSPDAETYSELLASVVKIEKQLAQLSSPVLRTQTSLLQCLPPNTVLYGAVPNPVGTIGQVMMLAEQQSAENAVFHEWWNSHAGLELRRIIDRIQTVMPLLGDEIVYAMAARAEGSGMELPMVIAEVAPGKRAQLESALDALRSEAGETALPYSLNDNLLIASDSQENLLFLLSHLGQGAAEPFAEAIASRYQRGVGWLLGMNMEPVFASSADAPEIEFTGASQMKHIFVEQRSVQGVEQNQMTLTFKGPRMGMASWLASSGSGGAAEYLSSDAVLAIYASTREPRHLFAELTAQLAKTDPSFSGGLAEAEARLGVGFAESLAAALGTEAAFSLEGLSLSGPVWVLTCLVNDSAVLDDTVRRLVEVLNEELAAEGSDKRITLEQETADGRIWTTLKTSLAPLSITWTYDRGYLVAASERSAAARAIAIRNGGSPLIWSAAFQQQLPASSGLHPSAFAWLNTRGMFQGFAAMVTNPTFQNLLSERDPILVVFNGTTEQIQASSRIRLSEWIVNLMLLDSLSKGSTGSLPELLSQGSELTGTR